MSDLEQVVDKPQEDLHPLIVSATAKCGWDYFEPRADIYASMVAQNIPSRYYDRRSNVYFVDLSGTMYILNNMIWPSNYTYFIWLK